MARATSSSHSAASAAVRKHALIGWGLEPAMHGEHDYLRTTGHTKDPGRDYSNFRRTGATLARSGLRTRFANPAQGVFDWTEAREQALAARDNGVFVYWDLAHYDMPRWISDQWSDETTRAFVELGVAFADMMRDAGIRDYGICVWNEILLWSFWKESGAEGKMLLEDGTEARRDGEWRRLGIRTTFAVMRAVHERHPHVKFLIAEPAHKEHILPFLAEMRACDPEKHDELVIGLNIYPHTDAPHSFDPKSYYVPLVKRIRAEHPRNEIIVSETSSVELMYGVEGWKLPDRMAWLESMLEVVSEADIPAMIWYPCLNHGGWDDESFLVEHGAWHQDEERTEFAPLIEAVMRENGVAATERKAPEKKAPTETETVASL